jgi:hypothetical protein
VSDGPVAEMLQSCVSLEKLVLKFCVGITDSSTFQHLAHTEKLRHLDLQGFFLLPSLTTHGQH